MPSLNFVLPHWLYWAALLIFPLVAMWLARRSRPEGPPRHSLALAYLVLVTGGIIGLHRFYLKNYLGLIYLPIFAFILYANAEQRDARSAYSDAHNLVQVAEGTIARDQERVEGADVELSELRAELEAAEEGSFAEMSAERRLERAQSRIESARQRLERARADLEESRPVADAAAASRVFWGNAAFWAFMLILLLLAIDAILLPRLVRQADEAAGDDVVESGEDEYEGDLRHVSSGWTGTIDRISLFTGEFVSYWAVIAVFVYYYEVVARYVFNSPTNWAHEGMFLMFGMQYLICGAYAMLTESHVRVDIFYARWARRRKAVADLLTSIFFFIFAGTLLVTSFIFAWDATVVDEVSFTEWAIAYWPMKWAMVIGGLLLVLQGISKFAQDLRALREA